MVNKAPAELAEMSPAEIKAWKAGEAVHVFGADAKKDRHGNPIEQGIGAKGRETVNHFNAIRKHEGEEAYFAAVAEIYGRDKERAEKLNLPKPKKVA